MTQDELYFDNSATTKISEEALACYCEVSRTLFGNPSSLHAVGKAAEDILRGARRAVAAAIGARVGKVFFTASGTESNNLVTLGRAYAKERYRRGRIVTTAGEHPSVAAPLAKLAREGFEVVTVPTRGGVLDMDALRAALTPATFLVSLMAVNNETGAAYDIAAAAAAVRAACPDCLLHVDATQALFKIPFDVRALGVRAVTLSSHKVEGPKGVGALWVDDTVLRERGLAPLVLGGGQEEGLRSGTENVPAIAAFATACELGRAHAAERISHLRALRERLLTALATAPALAECRPLLPPSASPHILTLILPGIRSEVMLHHLSHDGISVSSGSACSTAGGGKKKSEALAAFGCPDGDADCAIRISTSHRNTEAGVDALLASLAAGLARLARKK